MDIPTIMQHMEENHLSIVILQGLQSHLCLGGMGGHRHAACMPNAGMRHRAMASYLTAAIHHYDTPSQPACIIIPSMMPYPGLLTALKTLRIKGASNLLNDHCLAKMVLIRS